MEKLACLIWRPETLSAAGFRNRLLGEVAQGAQDAGARRLRMNLVDDTVADQVAFRIGRMKPPPDGLVTWWMDDAEERGPVEAALAGGCARQATYLVTESVLLQDSIHLPAPRERTPGVNVVTGIQQPEWIAREAWLEHWFGAHRKVALEVQCSLAYVRNLVVRAYAPDAPPFAGIVEERFPTEAIGNPMVWYRAEGSSEKLQENLGRMMASVRAFLDIEKVESHPMAEYVLEP